MTFHPEDSTGYDGGVRPETVKNLARECGFELAGIARAEPLDDFARYESWVADGMAGEMQYLTDRRAEVRRDARNLLPGARSVIWRGKKVVQRKKKNKAVDKYKL